MFVQIFGDAIRVVDFKPFSGHYRLPRSGRRSTLESTPHLNLLEHIEDDLLALTQMRDSLAPGGKLALLAPGHRVLYGEFGCSSSNV